MGALTAQAMVASGVRPVLAGRDQGRLNALAARLSQAGGGTELETAGAAAAGPGPLRDLIGVGDVLVSTAGPFMKIGRPAVAAAVEAGAIYLDSSGEPPFIRQVFEEFGPRAERTGAVLLTAFGYDYVPETWPVLWRCRPPGPPRPGCRSATSSARTSGGRPARAPRVSGRLATRRRIRLPRRPHRDRTDGCARHLVRDRRQEKGGLLDRLIGAFRAAQAAAGGGGRRQPRRRRSPTWPSTSAGSAVPPGSSTTAPCSPRR
jgi:hypothetical protein